MHIAVLGLGRMGSAIATRLLEAGHEVCVWNRSPGKAESLVQQGAIEALSVHEALVGTDAAITILSDDVAVREVCLGEDGVLNALGPTAVLIDMSTVSPDTSRALAAALPPERFLEAPVQGSPGAVKTGEAALLLAGAKDAVERFESLWNDLAARYTYCGPAGSATTLKIIFNLLLIGGITLLGEAAVTAQAAGISTETLAEMLGLSPLVAPAQKNRIDAVLTGNYESWFTTELAGKDVRLALELAGKNGLSLTVTEAISRVFAEAQDLGLREEDLAAVTEVVRRSTRAQGD